MMKTTLREIRAFVKDGRAVDITTAPEADIPTCKTCIAYSVGTYGVNGCVVRDTNTGKLYAVTARTTNLFRVI